MGNRGNHRNRDSRGSRDLPFPEEADEPNYFQRPTRTQSVGVDAEVLWFNPDKGFGFVKLADGSEAFLHIRALESSGHSGVTQGAQAKVILEDSPKGKQVSQVLEIAPPVGLSVPSGSMSRTSRTQTVQSNSDEQTAEGEVKWYNSEKGFGFITVASGGHDVFVHATALAHAGMDKLFEGQRVFISYAQGKKGLETRSIRSSDDTNK